MSKFSLHIPEPLADVDRAPWFSAAPPSTVFGTLKHAHFFERDVERVDPAHARAIVLPNNFRSPDARAQAYISHWAAVGERYGIPVFIFSLGDLNDRVRFDPRVRVLRLSVYRSTQQEHDIVMPTLTEDVGAGGISLRHKQEKPIVSFCGQAGYHTTRQWAAYALKNARCSVQSLWDPAAAARKVGVYWRRAALRACNKSPLISTNFIVRRSFSGAHATIELDPARARREFIASIVDADFVLAPKGDGNYSDRLLETLALGRIPVLIDTDAVLPLEHAIDYAKIVVRVPMRRVGETAQLIREFYDRLDEEEWQRRQRLARETFERYLRVDAFFEHFFTSLCAA